MAYIDRKPEEYNLAKIEWDDSLSVGIGLIDEQHKMLIRKLSDLSDALDEGREFKKISTNTSKSH
jgi:hemerythrin